MFISTRHDTFRWKCPDSCQTIGQEQFCDGIPHCPRGMDETKENCEVSQLPQKTAYSFYAYMLLLIGFYWVFLSQKKPNLEDISMTSKRMSFDAAFYKNNHLAQDTVDHSAEVKRLTFDKLFDVEEESVKEVCEEVIKAESEVHEGPEEIYNCVLNSYGGNHALTGRIVDPSGGVFREVKRKINQKFNSSGRWYGATITSMFFLLGLHHFDYIKDIGESRSSI